jgi:hypothetical protein
MKAKSTISANTLPIAEIDHNGNISNLDYLRSISTSIEPNEESIMVFRDLVGRLNMPVTESCIKRAESYKTSYIKVELAKDVWQVVHSVNDYNLVHVSGEVIILMDAKYDFASFYATKNSVIHEG